MIRGRPSTSDPDTRREHRGLAPSAGTAWRRAAVATLLLWVVTTVLVAIATSIIPAGPQVPVDPAAGFTGRAAPPPDAAGTELVRTGLLRADALWYLSIAADGYPTTAAVPSAAAFFPGYPSVVAATGALLGGRLELAAQLVALLGCVVALAGIHELAAELGGDALARGTVVATAAFPTSFFLLAPYSEGVFLAASTWALVHAARGRPGWAAGLAAIATVTRPVGVLLAIPLLLGVTRDATTGTAERWKPLAGIAVGGLAMLGHGLLAYGRPLAFLEAQDAWQRSLTPFVLAISDAARFGLRLFVDGSNPYHLLDLLVFVATCTGVVVLARRREWPLVAHGVASVVLWTSSVFPARPLMSTPRFALGVPAVLLGLGMLLGNERLGRAWLPISGALFAIHVALFTRWLFVF